MNMNSSGETALRSCCQVAFFLIYARIYSEEYSLSDGITNNPASVALEAFLEKPSEKQLTKKSFFDDIVVRQLVIFLVFVHFRAQLLPTRRVKNPLHFSNVPWSRHPENLYVEMSSIRFRYLQVKHYTYGLRIMNRRRTRNSTLGGRHDSKRSSMNAHL